MDYKVSSAVILAAGKGTRLSSVLNDIPKCLVKINKKSIIEYQLGLLEKHQIKTVFIVVGYLKDKIIKKIGNNFGNLRIIYIVNKEFEKTNNIYSLWLVKEYLNRNIILLEGDTLIEEKILTEMIHSSQKNIAVLGNFDKRYMCGTVVSLNSNGSLKEIFLKKEQKKGFDYTDKFKTVNVYKFSKDMLVKFMIPSLSSYIRQNRLNEYYEICLKDVIKKEKIWGMVTRHKWIGINNEDDLKRAKNTFNDTA